MAKGQFKQVATAYDYCHPIVTEVHEIKYYLKHYLINVVKLEYILPITLIVSYLSLINL